MILRLLVISFSAFSAKPKSPASKGAWRGSLPSGCRTILNTLNKFEYMCVCFQMFTEHCLASAVSVHLPSNRNSDRSILNPICRGSLCCELCRLQHVGPVPHPWRIFYWSQNSNIDSCQLSHIKSIVKLTSESVSLSPVQTWCRESVRSSGWLICWISNSSLQAI